MATITKPEKAFIFNPSMIKITGASGNIAGIKIGDKEVKRKISGGMAEIDVSTLIQNMFDRGAMQPKAPNNSTYKNISNIEVLIDGNHQITININSMWGALQIGEKYSQFRKMTFFTEFPFTTPVFIEGSGDVYVSKDDGAFEKWKSGIGAKHELDMTDWKSATKKVIVRNGTQSYSVFDDTFDDTFGVDETVEIYLDIELAVNKCTEGVYLRWVNKWGDFCYYLFMKNTEQSEVKDVNVNIEEYLTTTDFVNGFHAGTNHPKGKEAQRTMTLYAPLVDGDTFDFLTSLAESPVVDLYCGDDNWVRVNMAAGNVIRAKDDLQDFVCTVVLPKTFMQEL